MTADWRTFAKQRQLATLGFRNFAVARTEGCLVDAQRLQSLTESVPARLQFAAAGM